MFRCLTRVHGKQKNREIIDDIRNQLLQDPFVTITLDLFSLNIQRGRQHGLPDYKKMRVLAGVDHVLSPITKFSDFVNDIDTQNRLNEGYKGNINIIDPWVGIITQDPYAQDSVFGPLGVQIIGRTFRDLRDGDSFWYENILSKNNISGQFLKQIQKTTLRDIILRNTQIDEDELQEDVFHVKEEIRQKQQSQQELRKHFKQQYCCQKILPIIQKQILKQNDFNFVCFNKFGSFDYIFNLMLNQYQNNLNLKMKQQILIYNKLNILIIVQQQKIVIYLKINMNQAQRNNKEFKNNVKNHNNDQIIKNFSQKSNNQSNQPAIPFLLKKKNQNQNKNNKNNENHKNININSLRHAVDQSIYQVYQFIKNNNLENTTIAVVNPNLIMSYINQIYKDYKIKDPLKSAKQQQSKNIVYFQKQQEIQQENQTIKQYQQYNYNSNLQYQYATSHKRKKSISINQKVIKLKQDIRNCLTKQSSNQNQLTNRVHVSPFKQLLLTTQNHHKQILPLFRYCFQCQQPILQANIIYHQNYQCQNFKKLYDLNLIQIYQILKEKLRKLSNKLAQNFNNYKNAQFKKQRQYSSQILSFDQSMNFFINELDKITKTQSIQQASIYQNKIQFKRKFENVNYCVNSFLSLLQITQKVYWFGQMLKTIQQMIQNQANKKSQRDSIVIREEDNAFKNIHFPGFFIKLQKE